MTGNVVEERLAEKREIVTRRSFLVGGAAAAAGLALYSGEWARHELSVVSRSIAIDSLPSGFEGFRVVQISDIHFDEYTEAFFVRRVVEEVNALGADLVLLTGDFISMMPLSKDFSAGAIGRCAEVLRGITCPRRFGVMGNHDTQLGIGIVRPALASVGIPLLVDEYMPVERAGQRLWLCGVRDPVTEHPDLNRAIPEAPDGPVLLMCHGPDYADKVMAHPRGRRVDLMLSGHTHGGQVRVPWLGAVKLPEGGKLYDEGLFRLGQMQLYVNRGVGTVGLPFRLNCPPEITLFTLQKAVLPDGRPTRAAVTS